MHLVLSAGTCTGPSRSPHLRLSRYASGRHVSSARRWPSCSHLLRKLTASVYDAGVHSSRQRSYCIALPLSLSQCFLLERDADRRSQKHVVKRTLIHVGLQYSAAATTATTTQQLIVARRRCALCYHEGVAASLSRPRSSLISEDSQLTCM